MAFWKTMTIAEMNALMEEADHSEVMKHGWEELFGLIEYSDRYGHNELVFFILKQDYLYIYNCS